MDENKVIEYITTVKEGLNDTYPLTDDGQKVKQALLSFIKEIEHKIVNNDFDEDIEPFC